MLSAILFDLDGTLVNTDPLHFLTWQDVLKKFGMSFDHEWYNQHISGRTNLEIIQDILPQLSLEEGLHLAEAKEARFRESVNQLEPVPGLLNLLNWVESQALKKAVVTNAPGKNAQFMLAALQLTEVFPLVVLAEDAPPGKPDPAPYLLALECLQVKSNEVIVFEDSPSGIRSAVAAGLYTIGVVSNHQPEYLAQLGTKMVIKDFTEPKLWDLLNSI
ncbi:MAG: HAD-IA family hydrolase [Gomphosphaeria aponina SAG 52.96 = DSM 107014]|uniref:HAD-IA family hydrolase n=1 Tax=Gomphosphaeria aponina SAG 52.96 = DSM 107014 TaxID=1521640 RepID=A0A941JMM5_9CHRO|nr:HAD-IA family hydrolase [Gomphosphaeria aponina SAG 52.96 = DSM 107014]